MKISRRQLKNIINEMLFLEAKGEHVGKAQAEKHTADHAAEQIANPKKGVPAFKLYPKFDSNHAGYEFHITDKGAVGGGLHGVLVDSEKGLEIEGGVHVEIPGLSGEEGLHSAAEVEISKAIAGGNLNIYAKGEAATHLETDHGKIHIGHPEVKGQVGVHGTFGKGKHHKDRH
jgi:hypothetical protein